MIAAVLFAGSMMATEVTVTKSVHDLFPDDVNGTQEATLYSDAVLTISVNPDGHNGKVYGTGTEWRLYQSNNAVVTVSATDATIKTVAFEFTVKNTGVLNYADAAMESNVAVTVNAASAQFVVANSGAATNGQVIIKGFTVVYDGEGGGDTPGGDTPGGDTPPVVPEDTVPVTGGTEVIFTNADFAGQGTANSGSEVSATKDGVTFTFSKGYSADESLRCYAHGSLSITATSTISKINFTTTGDKTGGLDAEVTVNATSYTVADLASQARFTEVKVTLAGGGDVPPVEDACNWDEIAFLGNGSGNAAYTDRFKVCVGDPAPSSVVNIQSSFGTEPGIYVTFPSAEFGAISLNEDQYAIQGAGMLLYVSAFLYDAETEVTVVCQNVEYTLTVKNANPETAPVEPITCFDIYQMAKYDVVDLLNDVTVTYANGKNVWVVDGSASMLIYFSANTNYAPGDVLSGVAGVVDIYNGVYEIKPSADQAAAIVATPGEVPAAIQTVVVETADMNKYIVMPGIQFEADAAFAEGTQSNITMNGVTVRNQFKNGYAFEAGKKYNVYGVVTIYQNNPQVYFITAEELDTTGFDNATTEQKAIKLIEDGKLVIIKNGVRYNAQGVQL